MATEPRTRTTRRQRHQAVRSTFAGAALELLEDASFKDLTIDDIARAAGATRSAFYFYFRDKQDLLLALTADVADALYQQADRWWHGDGDRATLVREALQGVASVYAQNARLLRAATEVSTYDEEVREFWRALVERFITATADHLRREQKAGRIQSSLEPERTAESLVWMVERCCYIYLSSGERTPTEVIESLVPLWIAALYPESR